MVQDLSKSNPLTNISRNLNGTNNSTLILNQPLNPSFTGTTQLALYGLNEDREGRDVSTGPNCSSALQPGRTSRLLTEMLTGFKDRDDGDNSPSPLLTPKSSNLALKDQTKKVLNTYYTKVPLSTANLGSTVSPVGKSELKKSNPSNIASPLSKLQNTEMLSSGLNQPTISKLVLERNSPLTRGVQAEYLQHAGVVQGNQTGAEMWANPVMYRGPSDVVRLLEPGKKSSAAEEQAAKMKKLASGVSTRESVKDQLKRYDNLKMGQQLLKKTGTMDDRKRLGPSPTPGLYLGPHDFKRVP